ncbi:hypothetical protein Tco_1107460 [Tanacetum coccineum]
MGYGSRRKELPKTKKSSINIPRFFDSYVEAAIHTSRVERAWCNCRDPKGIAAEKLVLHGWELMKFSLDFFKNEFTTSYGLYEGGRRSLKLALTYSLVVYPRNMGDTPEVGSACTHLATIALAWEYEHLELLLSMMLEQSAGLLSKKLATCGGVQRVLDIKHLRHCKMYHGSLKVEVILLSKDVGMWVLLSWSKERTALFWTRVSNHVDLKILCFKFQGNNCISNPPVGSLESILAISVISIVTMGNVQQASEELVVDVVVVLRRRELGRSAHA